MVHRSLAGPAFILLFGQHLFRRDLGSSFVRLDEASYTTDTAGVAPEAIVD
jgi:hypothetical protein